MLDTMRAFLAVNLELAALRFAADVAKEARTSPLAPDAAWVPPTKLHVTLRFLGDVDVGIAPALSDLLRSRIADTEAPRTRVGPFGAFPSVAEASVVFLSIEDVDGGLSRLLAGVTAFLDELGFAPEARPYVPHLTVARCRRPTDLRPWMAALPDRSPIAAFGTEVVLYRSDLPRPGAEYVALERVPLVPSRGRSSRPPSKTGRPPRT